MIRNRFDGLGLSDDQARMSPSILVCSAMSSPEPTNISEFPEKQEDLNSGKIILVDNCLDQKNVSLRIAAPPVRTRDYAAAMPMPMSERRRVLPSSNKSDPFHIIHKIPFGDCPYVRAKHAQLNWSDEGVEAIMSFGIQGRFKKKLSYLSTS
ncbi:hypothetical protein F2Q70_00013208 [Brassica cretica]|uniref:Uncharacterized protein n=1 Tax=Brassica cretica TaxID=69181 RepID=A0A8S9M7I7_BRACR|nr:hypothetical protein F2Q70_00013208 [Brassica cretica]